MPIDTLRADCTRCAALCCVALAFDRSALFAYDKKAGEACRHLDRNGRCAIHASRKEVGFGGCAAYDCLGAGQFVTQTVFGGRSWRDDASLLGPMIMAFALVRELRGLLLLLNAKHVELPDPARRRRAEAHPRPSPQRDNDDERAYGRISRAAHARGQTLPCLASSFCPAVRLQPRRASRSFDLGRGRLPVPPPLDAATTGRYKAGLAVAGAREASRLGGGLAPIGRPARGLPRSTRNLGWSI
jgi:hypothetical protein